MYAEFYQKDRQFVEGQGWTESEKLVPGAGARAVFFIDGRNALSTCHEIAKQQALEQGYAAYRLFKGPMSRKDYITDLMPVTGPPTPTSTD